MSFSSLEIKPSSQILEFFVWVLYVRELVKEIHFGLTYTAPEMTFSTKDFFGKFEKIRWKLRICSDLLKKSLTENFIFCAMITASLPAFTKEILSRKFSFSKNISCQCFFRLPKQIWNHKKIMFLAITYLYYHWSGTHFHSVLNSPTQKKRYSRSFIFVHW